MNFGVRFDWLTVVALTTSSLFLSQEENAETIVATLVPLHFHDAFL